MAGQVSISENPYRALTAEEIIRLEKHGCTCSDWSGVEVRPGFDADRVIHTQFSGVVRLGVFDNEVSFFGGVTRPSGISHAAIHNCTIGNGVYISEVRNYIANYVIEDNVAIENIDMLAVEGESKFGNGEEVNVLDETGGRVIPIYDKLSAQTAYIMAFYRYRPKLIEKLRAMIAAYAESVKSTLGTVSEGSRLINCRVIKNVKIGPKSVIEGVNRLENGSVNGSVEDPVYIGSGVFAEDFICASGSKVTDGAIIGKCFVGQGTVLAKQYSAEHSVFFANCTGFHGEACAIFAGPYTVTHHKSTLLIAGLFSFLNAGSGSNQSNHMYKLGPIHQGIVERGCKTTSDSYILWPAKIGAFSVVMGRHYRNSDTSELPFSYLIEHEDESVLVPGVNLRSVGTVRDARKWPQRDKRKDSAQLDLINFKLLSPYTIQKMLNGVELLKRLKATSGSTSDYYTYHSVKIKDTSLEHGINFYKIGIDKFLGNCLIKRLEGQEFGSAEQLRAALRPEGDVGTGKWIDLAGLFSPQECVKSVLDAVEAGEISTLEALAEAFGKIHAGYPVYEWSWAAAVLEHKAGKRINEIEPGDIINLVMRWKSAVVELDHKLYADAKKEFAERGQIGFGIDGDAETRQADFAAVRGTFEENSFVTEIEKHIERKTQLADELIGRMNKIAR